MPERSVVTEGFSSDAPASGQSVQLAPGTRLGRYELLSHLSSGGMANVWIARQIGHHGFERLMALKTMRPDHGDYDAFRAMFLDEARIAARIRHANVVEVFDLGSEGQVVYLAMTLVEGDALSGLLRRRRKIKGGLPFGVAARIVSDALAGLHAAHELASDDGQPMQVVHRDISPQNILLGIDGSVRIADFGVAKAIGRLGTETDAGQVKGKVAYASPEQLRRQPLDRRTDIFSMGIVLWETFTGTQLFVGVDLMDTLAKALEGNIPDPRSRVPSLPEELARVVMRAVAREPSDRFATAAEMSDALEAATRPAGITASSKDVAALVNECCGDEIARRRAELRNASRAVSNEPPTPRVAEPLTPQRAKLLALHPPLVDEDAPTERSDATKPPGKGVSAEGTLFSAQRESAPRHEMTMAGTVQSTTRIITATPPPPSPRAKRARWATSTLLALAGIAVIVGTVASARLVGRRSSSAAVPALAPIPTPAEIPSAAPPSTPSTASVPAAVDPAPPADSSASNAPRRPGVAPRPRSASTPNASVTVKTRYPNPYER